MSLHRTEDGITDEDRRILRLFKLVSCEGSHALLLVFKWGCRKTSSESLTSYLSGKGWTNKELKNRFDNTMREKLASDPTGDTYDISLLWTCIKFGCEGLASDGKPEWKEGKDDMIESICTTIKNFRNGLCHGTSIPDDKQMTDMSDKFKKNLKNLVQLAGDKYGHKTEIAKEQQTMEDSVKKIMAASLSADDISLYPKMLEELRKEQRDIVKDLGKTHLPERYKTMSKVDPASFITGKQRLRVRRVFTQLEVICEKKGSGAPSENIDCEGILELKIEEGDRPAIVLVEGDAGAGKTTFASLILDDWAYGNTTGIRDLDYFDLILYAEGRNKNISSFLDLLMVLMPHAAAKLTDEDLVRSVLDLNVLLIIDGLDELNPASRALIEELVDKLLPQSCNRLHLLMTTRPYMLTKLPSITKNHPMVHTRLKGISPDKWEDFVTKLHEEMKSDGQSDQDTSRLVDFVRRSRDQLGAHYRLPLNLTLLTYLWAADPSSVNSVTSATGLYIALHKLVQSRLLKRLRDNDSLPDMSENEIQSLFEKFLQSLYTACLETLKTEYMQLSDEIVGKLRGKCTELSLKFEEMTAPFLCVDKEWHASGYKLDLSVPHKSIMEFYAAHTFLFFMVSPQREEEKQYSECLDVIQNVCVRVLSVENKEKLRSIVGRGEGSHRQSLRELVQHLLEKNLDGDGLSRYLNVFLHLGGLLAYQENTRHLEEYAEELVLALEQADIKGYQWLDLVVETNCNTNVARLVAANIKKLGVRDGHTVAALALLPHLNPSTCMEIILEAEVRYVPQLRELLIEVARRDCCLEVLLKHQWKNSDCGTSDSLLLPLCDRNARCGLIRLTAYLDNLESLPNTITDLRLSIVNDTHAARILGRLRTMIEGFSLEYLGLHVLPDVEGRDLTRLPQSPALWLSGVNDDGLERVVNVVTSLICDKQCKSLFFPRSNLTAEGVKKLVVELSKAEIQMGRKCYMHVICPTLTHPDQIELVKFASNKLQCMLFFNDARSIW